MDRGVTAAAARTLGRHHHIELGRVGWDDKQPGLRPIRHAWQVEVAHGRLGRSRRLAKSFENNTTWATGWLQVACVATTLRHLSRARAHRQALRSQREWPLAWCPLGMRIAADPEGAMGLGCLECSYVCGTFETGGCTMAGSNHPQGLQLDPGYHSVNPYFVVDGVADFIEFLVDVFDGREETKYKEELPDGRIDHADVFVGDSIIMMSEGEPPRPSVAFVFVPDVDESFRRALARGSTARREPGPVPWGDRVAGFTDPWNNRWWVATPGAG